LKEIKNTLADFDKKHSFNEQQIVLPVLIVDLFEFLCAFPVQEVIETLPVLQVRDIRRPSGIQKVAIIRGEPIEVYDLSEIISGKKTPNITRFLTIRTTDHTIALAVSRIIGIETLTFRRTSDSSTIGTWQDRLIILIHGEDLITRTLFDDLRYRSAA
jgi:chemotaxis signal transduction protein